MSGAVRDLFPSVSADRGLIDYAQPQGRRPPAHVCEKPDPGLVWSTVRELMPEADPEDGVWTCPGCGQGWALLASSCRDCGHFEPVWFHAG